MKKLFFCLLLSLLTPSCSRSAPPRQRPIVLVTIAPYAQLVEQLAPGLTELKVLVPPGADPHFYEPTLRESQALLQTTLWLRLGEPVEERIATALKNSSNTKTLDLRSATQLIAESPGHHHHYGCCGMEDLHYWLSPRELLRELPAVVEALAHCLGSENEPLLRENASLLSTQLQNLDKELTARLAPISGKKILVSHPALGYFCRDYGLIQLSVEEEGKEPKPKHLAKLMQTDRSTLLPLFLDTSRSRTKASRVAEMMQLPVAVIDPYAQDYAATMDQLATLLLASYAK